MPKSSKSSKGPNVSKAVRAATEPKASFASYISKSHKTLFKEQNLTLSKGATQSLNQMCFFFLDRLAEEGTRAARYAKSSTLNLNAAKAANALVIKGKLRGECDKFASAAVVKILEASQASKDRSASA